MRKAPTVLLLLFAMVIFSVFAEAQSNIDRAKRTLDSGIRFFNQADYKNALQDFNTVINGYSDTQWVDEALLWVAKYHFEVEKDIPGAREKVEEILEKYASSNSTPDAYFYLGFMLASVNSDQEVMKDGLANYERVERLFPESEIADDALLNAARLNILFSQFDQALSKLQRILIEYKKSDLHDRSQYFLASCYYFMDNKLQAMVEYQKVRDLYPESDYAIKALDKLTLLYRIYFQGSNGKPIYSRDREFRPSLTQRLDDPAYIKSAGVESFHLADRGKNTVYTIDNTGKITDSISVRNPEMLKISHENSLIILSDRRLWNGRYFSLSRKENGQDVAFPSIRSFCVGPSGNYFFYDNKLQQLHKYNSRLEPVREFRGQLWRDVRDLDTDEFGNLYVLEGRNRQIIKYNVEGRSVFTKGPKIGSLELRDPVALDVDSGGHVYILDRRLKSVLIFDSNGSMLSSFNFGDVVSDPRGLTVDESGALYILDRRNRTVLKYN